jgi:FOG: FHA domain
MTTLFVALSSSVKVSGMPKLIVSGVTHELVDEAITIGRGPDNTIVVNDPSISTHHAQLLLEGDTYRLKDLDSTNGTRVNGKPVTETCCGLMIGFGLAQPKRDMSRRKSAVQNRCRSLRRSRLISRKLAQSCPI